MSSEKKNSIFNLGLWDLPACHMLIGTKIEYNKICIDTLDTSRFNSNFSINLCSEILVLMTKNVIIIQIVRNCFRLILYMFTVALSNLIHSGEVHLLWIGATLWIETVRLWVLEVVAPDALPDANLPIYLDLVQSGTKFGCTKSRKTNHLLRESHRTTYRPST